MKRVQVGLFFKTDEQLGVYENEVLPRKQNRQLRQTIESLLMLLYKHPVEVEALMNGVSLIPDTKDSRKYLEKTESIEQEVKKFDEIIGNNDLDISKMQSSDIVNVVNNINKKKEQEKEGSETNIDKNNITSEEFNHIIKKSVLEYLSKLNISKGSKELKDTTKDGSDIPSHNSDKLKEEKGKSKEENHNTSDEQHKSKEENHNTSDEQHKSRDEQHKSKEENHKSRDEQPKSKEENYKSRDEQPKSRDEQPKSRDEQPKSKEENHKSINENHNNNSDENHKSENKGESDSKEGEVSSAIKRAGFSALNRAVSQSLSGKGNS